MFQEKFKPTDSSFTGTSFLVTIAVIPVIAEKSIDLRRKAAYKKRHKSRPKSEKQQQYRIGRDYDEFQRFMLDNPDCPVVQMDKVKGKREKGKVILTMLMLKYDIVSFRNSLQVGFLCLCYIKQYSIFNNLYEKVYSFDKNACFPTRKLLNVYPLLTSTLQNLKIPTIENLIRNMYNISTNNISTKEQ